MSGGHRGSGSERWLLTYSDLITLLLAFFIVMYSMSNQDLEKFRALAGSMREVFNPQAQASGLQQSQQPGPPTEFPQGSLSEDFAFIRAQMLTFAEATGLGDSVEVTTRPEGVAIVLSSTAIFASGRAELGERAYPVLEKVAEILAPLRNQVRVEGHTDSLPTTSSGYASNWELSAARAVSVVRYLTESAGLAPERFSAIGCGEHRPVAENNTAEGRSKNRRVEILVIYPREE